MIHMQGIIKNKALMLAGVGMTVLLAGCSSVKPPSTSRNPPPSEVFSNFSQFELKRLDRSSSCEKLRGADVALNSVEIKLNVKLNALIKNWEESPTLVQNGRKLIIEPVCANARMVGTGARLGLGLLAGESALVLNVRYIDASTGKAVATPVFYQRTNVFSGTATWGATDINMVDRIASLIATYTATNYDKAVGGPTGAEDQDIARNQ